MLTKNLESDVWPIKCAHLKYHVNTMSTSGEILFFTPSGYKPVLGNLTFKCKFKKKWKIKKRNSGYTISFEIIRKQQKWIINGKQGQKKVGRICYQWELWCVFEKKRCKKTWKCYMRGCFWREKKKEHIRCFLNEFLENAQISPIGKADYFLTS